MNSKLFSKLAWGNIKNNLKLNLPYAITCILTTSMLYMVSYLANNPSMSTNAKLILNLGQYVVAIFAFIFLIYSNSFIFKNRKKEFGVFNILGLEKRHIAKIIGFETLYMAVFSIVVGLAVGVASSKLLFLGLAKIMHAKLTINLEISKIGIIFSAGIIVAIFVILYIKSVIQIMATKTIDLLKGEQQGEKEPKAKWLLAILGAAALGYAYYLSLTIKNPLKAMNSFFIAVIFVIIGTYLLFTAGSIVLLKCLKKNKNYYYKTNHFISVSGMIYRMKQNAAGLSNICILSTTVMVMLSSSISLFTGIDASVNTTCPATFVATVSPITLDYDKFESLNNDNFSKMVYSFKDIHKTGMSAIGQVQQAVQQEINEKGLTVESENILPFFSVATLAQDENCEKFKIASTYNLTIDNISEFSSLQVITCDAYNQMTGENLVLEENQVASYITQNGHIVKDNKTFELTDLGLKFDVAKNITKSNVIFDGESFGGANIAIVVKDFKVFDKIFTQYCNTIENPEQNYSSSPFNYCYLCNVDADENQQKEIAKSVDSEMRVLSSSYDAIFDIIYHAEAEQGLFELYGSVLFLALFLGILFTVAMILIIYYKQISEGYDDKKRFEIMQNVGLSQQEVKSAINSQVLTVFFLPLITAFIHMLVACPILKGLLSLMSLGNTKTFVLSTASSIVVFAVIYLIVYMITSRVYYKIVKK